MTLGVNLSFCVKRWVTPALWAPVVKERLGVTDVQLSFDLVDPLWPQPVLDQLSAELRAETARHGLIVHSAFIGLAHYTYSQLLHPSAAVRDAAEVWLGRAYAFAARAGIGGVGGPLGAMASRIDGHEEGAIPEADYQDLLQRMRRLAAVAAGLGLTELYVEATPMRREWPWTTAQAERMLDDLAGTPVPWKLCVDWGHATYRPLYGATLPGLDLWLALGPERIGVLHLQQTDGELDRHWDFTEPGIVDPGEAAAAIRRHGLEATPLFLEVFYPFERADAAVLDGMARSMALLRPAFGLQP